MSQKSVVLAMLKEAGAKGVEVHELVYRRGITRAAAIVHDLKNPTDGSPRYDIETIPGEKLSDGRTALARYVLRGYDRPKPPPVPGFFDEDPPPARDLPLPCGCVRSADGRSWLTRCTRHAGRNPSLTQEIPW